MMAGPLQDMHCRLAALLQGLLRVPEEADRAVHGLAIDSRRIRPGDLFLACRGRTVDGAEYIDEAIARGAVAVLWEPQPGAAAIPLAWRQPPEREAIPVLSTGLRGSKAGKAARKVRRLSPGGHEVVAGFAGSTAAARTRVWRRRARRSAGTRPRRRPRPRRG